MQHITVDVNGETTEIFIAPEGWYDGQAVAKIIQAENNGKPLGKQAA